MALLGALCFALNTVGFTHRSLRAHVSQLLGAPYNTNQMSYDLARLRINALIQRREHTNTYDLTPEGQRVAVFYTKVHDRLLRSPPTNHPHQQSYATPWPPSTDTSTPTPTTPASETQPENSRQIHEFVSPSCG
jgi:hypothetical protein